MFKKSAIYIAVIFSFSIPLLSVFAFTALTEVVATPYDIVTINEPEIEKLVLGELLDAPEMFEIVSEDPFTFSVEIRALPDRQSSGLMPPQFSGIIIKQNEIRGVTEIARLKSSDSKWNEVRDKVTGLAYLAGPAFTEQLEPGTYRIEISTPDNTGKYMLLFGAKPDKVGYFETLSNIKNVYNYYGLGGISMFSSPYIHYPIGIVVLIILISGTWFWQRKHKIYV